MDKEFIEKILYYGKAIGFRDAIIALMEIALSENIILPETIMIKLDERKNELYPNKRKSNNDDKDFDEEPPEIDSDFRFDPFMGQFSDEV